MNIIDYCMGKFNTGRKLNNLRELYRGAIMDEEQGDNRQEELYKLKLGLFVEPQTIMVRQAETLVKFY